MRCHYETIAEKARAELGSRLHGRLAEAKVD
jgi:hypothetical protein